MSGSQSYDDIPAIGELYDHVRIYQERRDVPFYIEEAKRAGGPVLELGCGTGRVLLPTARAGVTVTGLDRSPRMLERCRQKLAAESAEVRQRVDLVEADLRAFDLGRRYVLVTIPFRAMQHQTTIDDQLAALACIRRHLAPNGHLIFEVFNPNFAIMTSRRDAEHEDTPRTELPDGRSFRRASRVLSVDFIDQLSHVEIIWYITDAAGLETRHVQAFAMRWYLRAEIEHLLARAGFRVDTVFGDFDRSPLTSTSPEIILVASGA